MNPYDDAELVAVLPVADLDRSEAFYGRLGFAVLASRDGYRILHAGDTQLHLVHHPGVPLGESPSGVYLYLASALLADQVHAAWAAAGVHVLVEPADQPYGLREFAAQDPDGNLWRVGGLLDTGVDQGGGGATLDRPAADESGPTVRVSNDGDAPEAKRPSDGSVGTGDDAWLAIVAKERCEGCGLTASEGAVSGLAGRLRDEAYSWSRLLTSVPDDAVRTRRQPQEWSALEYGVHTRDVLAVFADRILRTLFEATPDLGWWDHEAAIADGFANESDVSAVSDDLGENSARLAEALAHVKGDGWARTATRGNGEVFTVELMARFVLHEVVHHRVDAERALGV